MNITPTFAARGRSPWDWRVHVRYRNAKGNVRTKIIGNRPVSCEDDDWQMVNEDRAKRNALNSIIWGWKFMAGRGFRVSLLEHPEDVIDVRIVRRHKDKVDSSKEAQLDQTIKEAVKALQHV